MTAAPILAPVTVTTRVIHKRPFVMPYLSEESDRYVATPKAASTGPTAFELCEFCALSLVRVRSAFEKEKVTVSATESYEVFTTRAYPLTTLKPIGEPCPRCGKNEPRGTYPWRWHITSRIGEGPGTDKQPYQWITYAPTEPVAELPHLFPRLTP